MTYYDYAKRAALLMACGLAAARLAAQTVDVTKFADLGHLDPSIEIVDGGNLALQVSGNEIDISAQNRHFTYLHDERLSEDSIYVLSVKVTVPPNQGGLNDVGLAVAYPDANGALDGIRYNLRSLSAGVTDHHVRIVKASKQPGDIRVYADEVDVTSQALAPDDLSSYLGADANQGVYLLFGNPPAVKRVIWSEATFFVLND